jgi:hypothetical protein
MPGAYLTSNVNNILDEWKVSNDIKHISETGSKYQLKHALKQANTSMYHQYMYSSMPHSWKHTYSAGTLPDTTLLTTNLQVTLPLRSHLLYPPKVPDKCNICNTPYNNWSIHTLLRCKHTQKKESARTFWNNINTDTPGLKNFLLSEDTRTQAHFILGLTTLNEQEANTTIKKWQHLLTNPTPPNVD